MNSKNAFRSKTILFNLLVLAGLVAGLFGFADYVPSAGDQENINMLVALIAALVPVINMILRVWTDRPVSIFGATVSKRK